MKSASLGRRQETGTSSTEMYFRKRFTDSSRSTRHPRQRKWINISEQQYSCKVPISPGSAGLCRLPCTAGHGDLFCAKGERLLLVLPPGSLCAQCMSMTISTGSCSVCGLWKAKLALNTRGFGGFFAYNLNYSYIVRFKGKSTGWLSECWHYIIQWEFKTAVSGSATKMKFPLSTPILCYRKNIYKIQEWLYQILAQAGSYTLTEFQNSLLRCLWWSRWR